MPDEQKEKVPPICLALVLCDAVWHDPGSGKRTILGVFSTIIAQAFPAQHGQMTVYCALTDGYGPTEIEIRLVDTSEEESQLLQAKGMIEFSDPRLVVEMDMPLLNIVFPAPGEYRIQVLGAGVHLLERRLLVIDPTAATGE